MRYKLGKYQGQGKHEFTAEMVKYGSYIDRDTGKTHKTILFKNVTSSNTGEVLTDHAWIKEDCYTKDMSLKKGTVYRFEAKVGIYNRGRTAKDYQLNKVRQLKAA